MFYVYMWLREDGSPYYVGKGSGRRAYRKHRVGKVPPMERTVFYIAKDEAEAFEIEVALIWYYGREDLGIGRLLNLTDGGEGVTGSGRPLKWREAKRRYMLGNVLRKGIKHTPKICAQIAASHKGKKFSVEHRAKISASSMGNKGGHIKNHVNKNIISEKCKWCMEGTQHATKENS